MRQARTVPPLVKIAGVMWLMALMIIMASAAVWLIVAVMSGDYYANSKAVRDAADAANNAGVLSQLGSIEALKAWVVPLQFLGIAAFIAGFGFAFANILRNVRLRGNTMAEVFPELKQRKGA